MLIGEGRIAQLCNGKGLAGFVIVAQPEGVPHLMGHNIAQCFAGNFVSQGQRAGAFINGGSLDKIPLGTVRKGIPSQGQTSRSQEARADALE